jgi:hypothetical protein
MISYIHYTKNWFMASYVGDEAKDCWLALFCDASFAGDLVGSKSTSGVFLALVGPRTFVPITWFCKKQGAVSHSSSEAEIISLDAGVRLEGIPCLLLWELVLEVFDDSGGPPPPQSFKEAEAHILKKTGCSINDVLVNIDFVPPSMPKPTGRGTLVIFEDNEAVIKMCIKSRAK